MYEYYCRCRLASDMPDHSPSLSPSPPPQSYYADLARHSYPQKSATSSNYWNKKLLKFEETFPLRWGHSGYKDQHPDEFASTADSDVEEKNCPRQMVKRRKRARMTDTVTKKSRYEEREKREKKRIILKRRKERTSDCNSSSEESDSSSHACGESRRQKRRRRERVDRERRRKKRRKRHKEKEMECAAATQHKS